MSLQLLPTHIQSLLYHAQNGHVNQQGQQQDQTKVPPQGLAHLPAVLIWRSFSKGHIITHASRTWHLHVATTIKEMALHLLVTLTRLGTCVLDLWDLKSYLTPHSNPPSFCPRKWGMRGKWRLAGREGCGKSEERNRAAQWECPYTSGCTPTPHPCQHIHVHAHTPTCLCTRSRTITYMHKQMQSHIRSGRRENSVRRGVCVCEHVCVSE